MEPPTPVPPALDELAPFPPWVRRFWGFAHVVKGWGLLLLVFTWWVFILVTAAAPATLDETCGDVRAGPDVDRAFVKSQCVEDRWGWVAVASVVVGGFYLVGLTTIASGFAWFTHAGRRRRNRRSHEARVDSYKGWFIRGEIGEDEFVALRSCWVDVIRGRDPPERARTGAATALLTTALATLIGAIALVLFIVALAVLPDEARKGSSSDMILMAATTGPIALVCLAAAVWGWTRVPRTYGHAVRASEQLAAANEHKETQILAAVNRRVRSGVGPAARHGLGVGPSFTAYGEGASRGT